MYYNNPTINNPLIQPTIINQLLASMTTYLVGAFNPCEKYESQLGTEWKNKSHVPVTTNQMIINHS